MLLSTLSEFSSIQRRHVECTPDGHQNTRRVVKVVDEEEIEHVDGKRLLHSIKYPAQCPQCDAVDSTHGCVIPYDQDLRRKV